jgi:hypothetical protein
MIRQFQADAQLVARRQADPACEFHVIDYGHLVGGVLYHGTLSDLSGPVQSTWTYEEDGRLVRRNQPIDQETFTRVWDGLFQLSVFKRSLGEDLATPIDPTAQHVVGVVRTEEGVYRRACYLVPAGESSAEFAEWLRALNPPYPHTRDPEAQRVRVLLHPLATLLAAREQEKGAPLTREEVYAVRDGALCTMMSPAQAERFYASLHSQSGVPFIDPEFQVWEQWQAIRGHPE